MRVFRNFFLAIRFLTIIPLPHWSEDTDEDMAQAMYWFPLVGFAIGGAVGACWLAAANVLGSTVGSVVAVALLAVATGAIHLDGLADTCDGLLGGHYRQSRLRIMKDHNVGTFGLVAVALVLMLKVTCLQRLSPIPASGRFCIFGELRTDGPLLTPLLTVAFAVAMGRWAQVLAAAIGPYARTEDGTGKSFVDNVNLRHAVFSLLPMVLLMALLWYSLGASGDWFGRLSQLYVLVIKIVVPALVVVLALVMWCHARIGGVTGDTLGALAEATETTFLVLAVAMTAPASSSFGSSVPPCGPYF